MKLRLTKKQFVNLINEAWGASLGNLSPEDKLYAGELMRAISDARQALDHAKELDDFDMISLARAELRDLHDEYDMFTRMYDGGSY